MARATAADTTGRAIVLTRACVGESRGSRILDALVEVDGPGLVGVQLQPQGSQDVCGQLPRLVGAVTGGTDDDEVIGVARQHAVAPALCLPRLVEDVQGDVGQQRRDGRSLRGTGLHVEDHPALDDPRLQPGAQQLEQIAVADAPFDLTHQGAMVDLIKARLDVGIYHPLMTFVGHHADGLQRVVGAPSGSKPVGAVREVGLEDRLAHDLGRGHHDPIADGGDTKRPGLSRLPGLGDVGPPQRLRAIGRRLQISGELIEKPFHSGLFDIGDADAVDARRSLVARHVEPRSLQHITAGDLVIQRVEATLWLLLGAAVQHPLKGSNRTHSLGVTGGPSRVRGTHPAPPFQRRCTDEAEALPSPTVMLSAGSPVL